MLGKFPQFGGQRKLALYLITALESVAHQCQAGVSTYFPLIST